MAPIKKKKVQTHFASS